MMPWWKRDDIQYGILVALASILVLLLCTVPWIITGGYHE